MIPRELKIHAEVPAQVDCSYNIIYTQLSLWTGSREIETDNNPVLTFTGII